MRIRFAVALLFLSAGPPVRLSAQQSTVDILSYHFRIDLPDTGSAIRGFASVFFQPRRGYDDTLRLDLVGMTVRRVVSMRTLESVPYRYDGQVLRVATRGVTGDPRGVMVEYRGVPRDGLIYSARNARGRRAFFGDNWPNRARFWLPTVDHPSDKARVLWSVRAPRGWRVVTNAPQCQPRQVTRRCLESAPIPTYTMVLGATRFAVSTHRPAVTGRDTTPIEVWAFPEDSAWADSVPFARATEIVETMTRLIGPFPYARLAHVQSATRYGGMENSSEIFYPERAYVGHTLHESTVRHETAHQWFGDAVTEADWHHVWLSEGFATYFDLVIGAALSGDSVMREGLKANSESYRASRVVDRPIIDSTIADPNDELSANSYQKGGWVLHMLRGEVGDSAFFRGLREYYRRYRDQSVLTGELQTEIERAAGRRLGWFFDQWLRQPGYPQLEVSWRADSTTRAVSLDVAQMQPATWGTFALPKLDVEFRYAGQVITRRTIDLLKEPRQQTFEFTLDQLPDEIAVDPDAALLITSTVRGP